MKKSKKELFLSGEEEKSQEKEIFCSICLENNLDVSFNLMVDNSPSLQTQVLWILHQKMVKCKYGNKSRKIVHVRYAENVYDN